MGSSLSAVLGHVRMDPRGADLFVVTAVALSPRQMGQLGCFLPTCRLFWDSQAHAPRRSTGSVPTPLSTFIPSAFCIFVKQLHFFPRHDMPLTFFMASWGSLSPCVLGPSVSFSGACAVSHMLSKWLASCLWASLLCLSGARCGDKKALVSLCFQHNLLSHLSGCPVQWPRRARATSLSLSCPPGVWWAHVLCFHTARHSRVSSVNSSGPDTRNSPFPTRLDPTLTENATNGSWRSSFVSP